MQATSPHVWWSSHSKKRCHVPFILSVWLVITPVFSSLYLAALLKLKNWLWKSWRQNLLGPQVVCMCVCWGEEWGGWGNLVACMDRSVIQTAHTVFIVKLSEVPISSGWGGREVYRMKTQAAHRKYASGGFERGLSGRRCLWTECPHISSALSILFRAVLDFA